MTFSVFLLKCSSFGRWGLFPSGLAAKQLPLTNYELLKIEASQNISNGIL